MRKNRKSIILIAVIFLQVFSFMALNYQGITRVNADTALKPAIILDIIASGTAGDTISFNAVVSAASIANVELFYGNIPDGYSFNSKVSMDCLEGNNYKAELTPDKAGNIYYYIKATDAKGNTSTLPADISSCYYVMVEDGDIDGPVINHTRLIEGTTTDKICISTVITDMSPVTAYLYYRNIGETVYKKTTMITLGHDIYTAEVPAGEVTIPGMEYYVTAEDLFDNKAETGVYTLKLYRMTP